MKGELGKAKLHLPWKQLIILLDKLPQQLVKQQEHDNFASLVTGSDSVLDLQQSRVIERASLNSSVWFW